MREQPRFSRSAFPNSAAGKRPPIRGMYRAAAPLSDFAPVCIGGESFTFLFEELSRPKAG
jgi:hypothetical protein